VFVVGVFVVAVYMAVFSLSSQLAPLRWNGL